MHIIIDRGIDTPIYIQIRNQVRDMINFDMLPEGYSLPPERKLADMLGVNRSTVLKAYQELKADGLIGSHVGKGTRVLAKSTASQSRPKDRVCPILWNQLFHSNIQSANERIIGDIMEITSRKGVISFAAGVPSPELYPVKAIEGIQENLIESIGPDMFLHSPVEGQYPLRQSIAGLMKTRDISVSPGEVMVLSGSQQGVDLAARMFLNKDDIVFTEEPTYLGAIEIFRSWGARIVGVPVDQDGIRTDILESLLARYKPKFIYTLPAFQNPTGIQMSLERRYRLLDLAYEYQVPILEDDPYGELRYEGDFLPPLKALDRYGYVMYLSTFSKTISLGFRIGWVAAPKQVIARFSVLKQISDLHANTPAQWILDDFIRHGGYGKHLDMVRKEYIKKRDLMINALEKHKIEGMSWDIPKGGFYIWCRLPQGVSQSRLVAKAASQGVVFVPGEAFYPNGGQVENCIRLNFSFPCGEQIEEGIRRLAKAVQEARGETREIQRETLYQKKPII